MSGRVNEKRATMKIKVCFSTLVIFLFSIVMFFGCILSGSNIETIGNTNANISNGGLSAVGDGWIYFRNYSEGGRLYRIKTDGTNDEKVSNDTVYSLNYYDGWIYYCNSNDNNRIYKIRPDRKERTIVSYDNTSNVIVADNWIYYISTPFNIEDEDYLNIFRLKSDGSEIKKVFSQEALSFNLEGKWIFYLNNDGQKLHKVKVDGSGDKRISDVVVSFFCVYDKSIYYISPKEETKGIWRMNLNGGEETRLTEEVASILNPSGDWIYYGSELEDGTGYVLKKMRLDGTGSTVIDDGAPYSVNVHDNILIHISVDSTDVTNPAIIQTMSTIDGTWSKEYLFKEKAN